MDIRLRSVLKMNLRAAGNVAMFKMFMYANMVLTVPHNVEELEQLLYDVWFLLSQNDIDKAVNQWRVRLQACVKAGGGVAFYIAQDKTVT